MELKEIKNKEVEIITDIICDCCGKSCKTDEYKLDNGDVAYNFEYMTLSAEWGFGSKKDLEKWKAQICEDCVDKGLPSINFKTNIEYL